MATQSKKRAEISFFNDSQAVVGEDSITPANANFDNPASNANYDIASQVIYTSIDSSSASENNDNVASEEPVISMEDDAETIIADSTSNSSTAPNNEQKFDTPTDSDSSNDDAYDGATNPDIINEVIDNNATDAPIENQIVDNDQAIMTADVVNEEPDFYISSGSGSMCTNDYISFDSFTIASGNYMVNLDTSFVLDVKQNDAPVDIEDTVTDEDIISVDLVEADFEVTEEATGDLLDDSIEVQVEDYETPNEVIVDESGYIPAESIDNNTDPLAEVTDEPFIIFSSVSCWTMDTSYSLAEYIVEPFQANDLVFSLTVDDSSINNLTVDDTSVYTQTEVSTDDLTIIPLGLPIPAE